MPALAEPEPSGTELASARTLFNEARMAEERGDWTEALAKLDMVAKVKMTPQVRFHLGLCQEHTTQLVEALNSLERAASEGSEQNLPTVAAEAKEHAASVRARLPRLSIVLPRGSAARVEVDGRLVAAVLLSRPMAFDPGAHKIVATAPGVVFSQDISIGEREEKRVDVVFSADSTAALANATTGDYPVTDSAMASETSSTFAWMALGTGGVALVGASISLLVRQGAVNDIDSACPSHQGCPRSLQSSQSKASTFGTLAVVLAAFGGVSGAVGIVLLAQPRSQPSSATVSVGPWMTSRSAGATGTISW
jgi:hypothetical protein